MTLLDPRRFGFFSLQSPAWECEIQLTVRLTVAW